MFPCRSRVLFNNLQHMADVMAYDMERQLTRQWRRALDQWEREAHAQRYQHRDRHYKEFDQAREERHRHRDNHEEFEKAYGERQAHRDQYREFDQAREERHRHRDHHEGFDQAHAQRQGHRGRYEEFDKAREERRRYMHPFEQFDYGLSRGMRESFKDMNKNMGMEMESQTPPNVGKDVYYKMVMRTEENGRVKVKTMEKEPGSEWKIVMEEFKRAEKPVEDAKLKSQDKAQGKVQEKIAEPNKESQKIINEKS